MTTTPVTISGTFSKDSRPSNGLEEIAESLIQDQLGRHYVVGVVQFAGASVPGPNEPLVPRVKFLAIEPLNGPAADDAEKILDAARKRRGLGRIADETPEAALFDFDGDGHPTVAAGAETRLGPDGPHEVPEASAEEIMAERAEAAEKDAAAAAPDAAKAKATKARPTTTPFTPDGGDAA